MRKREEVGRGRRRRWWCRVSAPPLAVSAVPEPLLSRRRNPVGVVARQPLSFTPKHSPFSLVRPQKEVRSLLRFPPLLLI